MKLRRLKTRTTALQRAWITNPNRDFESVGRYVNLARRGLLPDLEPVIGIIENARFVHSELLPDLL